MKLFSRRPRGKSKENKPKRKILVISGGGFRGTYALGIMKAMEECGIKEEIDAIYGVSIGAIVGSLWSSGISAKDIFELLVGMSYKDFYGRDVLKKTGGFISSRKVKTMLDEYLPPHFAALQIPFYAGVVDTNSAEFLLFSEGDLRSIVLGSMSIPGIFSPVNYEDYSLVDGGVLNNFPVDLAKEDYPDHEIVGIALNKFQKDQKIRSAFDNLQVTFEVMMRSKLLENTKLVDCLFYRDLSISVLSLNKKQMHEAFALGYEDGINTFGNKHSN